jgi:hypothetical protein
MKRMLMIIALTSLLCIQGSAGQIPTGGEPDPSPSPITETSEPTSPGQIPTGGITTPGEIPCGDAVLSAILSVLGLVTG